MFRFCLSKRGEMKEEYEIICSHFELLEAYSRKWTEVFFSWHLVLDSKASEERVFDFVKPIF